MFLFIVCVYRTARAFKCFHPVAFLYSVHRYLLLFYILGDFVHAFANLLPPFYRISLIGVKDQPKHSISETTGKQQRQR